MDPKKMIKSFEKQRKDKLGKKHLKVVGKLSIDQELTNLKRMIKETTSCCKQCDLPVPLVCWRYKIAFFLQRTKLRKPGFEESTDLLQ